MQEREHKDVQAMSAGIDEVFTVWIEAVATALVEAVLAESALFQKAGD